MYTCFRFFITWIVIISVFNAMSDEQNDLMTYDKEHSGSNVCNSLVCQDAGKYLNFLMAID